MSAAQQYIHLKQLVEALSRQYQRQEPIKIIAVSKNHPIQVIQEVYQAGCLDFGENKVQEALLKQPETPQDIRWHFIGTLQSNKIGKILGKFALIHSIDSYDLAQKLSQKSQEANLQTSILLQVNTSGESTKHGWSIEGCRHDFAKILELKGVSVKGLMTMAPDVDDENIVRTCFKRLRLLRDDLEKIGGYKLPELSMGMSGDYPWAIAEGATYIRVGTLIFGTRNPIC